MSLLQGGGGGGGGVYARDKNTSVRVCAKNAGGAYVRGGAYLRDTTVMLSKNGSGLDFQGQTIVPPCVVGYTKLPGPLNNLSAIKFQR